MHQNEEAERRRDTVYPIKFIDLKFVFPWEKDRAKLLRGHILETVAWMLKAQANGDQESFDAGTKKLDELLEEI